MNRNRVEVIRYMHDYLSVAFVAVLPFFAVAPIWLALRAQTDYSLWERILFCPVYCLARTMWRVEVIGEQRLSTALTSGAVLVANHRCSIDPFFVQLAAGRRVHWMVAGEYFRNPIFGPILRLFQAIPTNRSGADNASMKAAIRLASEGRFVGMFPEGRINRTTKPLQSIRPGAAMVATKASALIIPCWIEGAPSGWAVWSGLFMSAHVRVFIGQAIDTKITELVSSEALISQAMQAALKLGGHTNETIELGGRKSR